MSDKEKPSNAQLLDQYALDTVTQIATFCKDNNENIYMGLMAVVTILSDMCILAKVKPEDVLPYLQREYDQTQRDLKEAGLDSVFVQKKAGGATN
jgi:hypothetical protein